MLSDKIIIIKIEKVKNISNDNIMTTKHDLGQYFTKNEELKEIVFKFIINNPSNILEPSIGRGDIVEKITIKNPSITFDMYEIDDTITFLPVIKKDKIVFGDFMKQNITKKYKTIIGNPPYVKTKKGNLYIDFVEKCFNLLENKGEIIFIVPSDFIKLTCSSKLLNKMMNEGTFTHIYHPNNEKLFENATIDIIVFRYCKDILLEKTVLFNDKLMNICNSDGLITFNEITNENTNNINRENNLNVCMIKDYFNVYVGIVSGKEEVFKNEELGNISVLNSENKIDKYICIKKFPSDNEKINEHLLKYKNDLINRKIRKFDENNWFEWGALRNISSIIKYLNDDCIYIYNLTRKTSIAFVGKVGLFGGNLIMLKPLDNLKNINLNKVADYFNSNSFKNNFMFSGRFKIGHRQISNSILPYEQLV